jgi:hypothetical protein
MADQPMPFDVEGPVQAEVYLVCLADGSIRLGGPDGPRAWALELGAGEHPVEAVDRIVRDVVGEPLLVHSTSWRRDRDAVVLSFLVVVDPVLVAAWPSAVVGREDLARSSARAAPAAIGTGQVLEHALRHLAWLAEDDDVVRTTLSDEWRSALAGYVPEPFRSLG